MVLALACRCSPDYRFAEVAIGFPRQCHTDRWVDMKPCYSTLVVVGLGLFGAVTQPDIFPGAVSTTSKVPDAAMALIKFLKTPAAVRVIRSQGMEPG
jgi:hypothetical protein